MAKARRSGFRSRADRQRTHNRTTAVEHVRQILDILCHFLVIYLVATFAREARKINQFVENMDFLLRSTVTATVNGLANISYVLYLIAQLISDFAFVMYELGILNVWHFLKWTVVTLSTAFVFVEDSIPLSKTGEVIMLILGLGLAKLIRQYAEMAKTQEILKTNLEESEAELKVKKRLENGQIKQQNTTFKEIKKLKLEISILETQNNELQSKVGELSQRTKALHTDKMQLKSQIESNTKKAERQSEEFAAKKQTLELQIKEVNLKLKKAEKQNQVFEEKMLKVKAKNDDLKLEVENEKDEKLCIICVDNNRNILLQPCNHFCMCNKCMLYKKWAKCPLCRQHIQSTLDVYV